MLKGKISADVAPLLFGDASCSREKVEVRLSQQESAGIVLKTLKTGTKAECKCFPLKQLFLKTAQIPDLKMTKQDLTAHLLSHPESRMI